MPSYLAPARYVGSAHPGDRILLGVPADPTLGRPLLSRTRTFTASLAGLTWRTVCGACAGGTHFKYLSGSMPTATLSGVGGLLGEACGEWVYSTSSSGPTIQEDCAGVPSTTTIAAYVLSFYLDGTDRKGIFRAHAGAGNGRVNTIVFEQAFDVCDFLSDTGIVLANNITSLACYTQLATASAITVNLSNGGPAAFGGTATLTLDPCP